MIATVVILAAFPAEVVEVIVLVILFLLAGLGQLVAKLNQPQPPAGGGGGAAPPRPARPVPADVANEIDEFLRRAAQQRGGKGVRPVRPAPEPPAAPPAQAQVVAPEKPIGAEVSEHVKKYLDADEFSRRADRLGEDVTQEVSRDIDQHLHQVFDHTVSRLAAVSAETAAPAVVAEPPARSDDVAVEVLPTFATDLATLLTSSDSVRQAIAMNEILRRPEERWQ